MNIKKGKLDKLRKGIDRLLEKKYFIPLILFVITATIYTHNLSPSIYGGDSGDLVAAALARGVPHPSGYPLYTMLGIIFLKIPFAATPAWKVGLISVLFSSLSVVLMYLIINKLTKNKVLGVLTSLTLAFLYPFWLYAEVTEVFALHSFFILIIIYHTISYWQTKKIKYLYLTAFFCGFSLTNNQVILLYFPATAFLLLSTNPKILLNFKALAKAFGLFLLGLLPYDYIPIAASFQPAYNWGNAVTLSNFLDLILRKQYGWGKVISKHYSPTNAFTVIFYYWKQYISSLIPALALIGSIFLIKKRTLTLFLYLIIAIIFTGPFFFIYSQRAQVDAVMKIGILEKFITQSSIPLILLFPFGVLLIVEIIKTYVRNKVLNGFLVKTTLAIFFLVPLSAFIVNLGKTNLRDVWIGDRFAQNIFLTAPANSILLFNTDHYIFNSSYYQLAYNTREDVKIPGAHSGFSALLDKSPTFSKIDIKNYNIEKRNYIDKDILLLGILDALNSSDIYVDIGTDIPIAENEKILAVPWGLLKKLELEKDFDMDKDEYLRTINRLWESYNLEQFTKNEYLVSENIMLADIRGLYILSLLDTADFLRDYYKDDLSSAIFSLKAFELDPLYLIRENESR